MNTIFLISIFIFSLTHNVFNVKNYGARGDGKYKDTISIRNAVKDLKEKCQRNCTLLFPQPGNYLTAPFNLTSNMKLFIEKKLLLQLLMMKMTILLLLHFRHTENQEILEDILNIILLFMVTS